MPVVPRRGREPASFRAFQHLDELLRTRVGKQEFNILKRANFHYLSDDTPGKPQGFFRGLPPNIFSGEGMENHPIRLPDMQAGVHSRNPNFRIFNPTRNHQSG